MLSLGIWPGSLGFRGQAVGAYTGVEFSGVPVGYLPVVTKALLWFLTAPQRPQTLAERNAAVESVRLSPHKLVGYVGDHVTFVGMGVDGSGQPAQGAKFEWESSDTSKLEIDEAGGATLLGPGLVRVTCRAGSASRSVPVLIRPTRRRLQTDLEWRVDQDSLSETLAAPTGFIDALPSLLDKLAPTAHAQGNSTGDYPNATWPGQVGTPPLTALEETRLGPVMPGSNFELPISLVNLGGRGLATSLTAYYNSNQWGAYFDPIRNSTVYVFDPIQSWPSPGFSLGFGRIVYYNGYTDPNLVSWHSFMLIEQNGTRHSLGVGTDYGANTLRTTDGSHITYVGNAADGGALYYNDGTSVTIGKVNNRLLPTQITDTNGNYVQVAYKWETNYPGIAINYIVDTLGRVIQFNYGEWPAPPGSTLLTSISTPTGSVTFNYQTVTMNQNFQDVIVENAPVSFSAISSVTIPQRPTHSFSYSGYGMIYSISLSTGGGNASVTYNYPLGGEALNGGPTFTQRTESPNAVYTYAVDGIIRPDGTKLILSGVDRELKSTTNTTLSKTLSTLTTDPGGSPALQSVRTYDELGQQIKTDFDYDVYGNVTNTREYGYQIGGQWKVRRRTHFTYINWEPYISAYMRNLVRIVEVFDALQNTNDADDVLVGKTVLGYDNPMGGLETYGGAASPPGHLSSYNGSLVARGNVTGVTSYSDVVGNISVTHGSKTDIFGNTTIAQVACCDQKSFTMTEATYWAKPSQTTTGSTSGIYLTSSAGYDFNTLATTTQTDPNNQTTNVTYDAQQNPTGFTAPTGANGTTTYNVWSEPTSKSVTYSDGGVNKTITETAVYDAWGQITQSVDANGAQTNYTYDNMGHRLTQTNPFPQGGTPGPVTTYQYDQLGRPTLVTLPGGNTFQTAFNGANIVTVTDQVNRKVKRESDGLGRLIKVTEQVVSTGALTQETSYTYDIADRLTLVNQGNQTRAFKYDAEGRLLFERIPELTATINDGTGTMWSTKYTYTDWGAAATKQDARGVITTYGYDSLHRMTSVTYNTSGAPGVAATPTVTYNYDNVNGSETKGLLLSIAVAGSYSESYAYDSSKRVSSVTRTMDGRSYTTSFQYNTANQQTQMTYPSGRVINFGHDNKGRLISAGSFLSSVTYNGIGQLTGTTLGNGVTESYGYDANRMQLTSQTATKSGGPANGLMNLTYGYQASAGQMGAGSTAGNAGQVMTISGTMAATPCKGCPDTTTTENASYTYDVVGRLVTSNQTSNGSSAQRRFSYDRWGNRTGIWDAVSGGNQIQSTVLQQSGGAPTNRLTSVTTSGITANYSYDADGNVTNDGVHTYTHDAENRIANVDGGTTATYAYDISNQRYKKVTGGVTTHYIWQGSQVIAEHNGSTGAVVTDYVYSGSRMIAKASSGATQYFLSDRLSTRLVLDAGGNVLGRQAHLPYGEDFGESGSQENHHFTSYERDGESGLDYAINRGYSPTVGRFQSTDAYRGSGGGVVPQTWNRYAYVGNDPGNAVDPLGLEGCILWANYGVYHQILQGGVVISSTLIGTFSLCLLTKAGASKQVGGSGSGPGGQTPKAAAVKFLVDAPNCVSAINAASASKGNGGKIGKVVDSLKLKNAVDYWNKSLKDLKFPPPLDTLEATIGEIRALLPTTTALTNWGTLDVYLYDNFYSHPGLQGMILVHEAFHVIFQTRDHRKIAEDLGLGKFATEEAAGDAIDDWLLAKCK
jgi:RHS repeat-associated protein